MHARKSLIFTGDKVWAKKDREGLFDVTMGSCDCAEVCQLVGAFLRKRVADTCVFGPVIGLCHNDGLAAFKNMTGHEADSIRKAITKLFRDSGLRITISTNQRTVNFLDVTFNLASGRYEPYRKPNDAPRYIKTESHYLSIIMQKLPETINKRVSSISCDQEA
eukprot:scpid103855/ scgid9857/ 